VRTAQWQLIQRLKQTDQVLLLRLGLVQVQMIFNVVDVLRHELVRQITVTGSKRL
jgi:hypothetical protein